MDSSLKQKHCEACEGIGKSLNTEQIKALQPQLHSSWEVIKNDTMLKRRFAFNNFHETMAFVNALAWVAHQENHHPDLELGYNYCQVHFMTHALQGLSLNDFICAAKIDALLQD